MAKTRTNVLSSKQKVHLRYVRLPNRVNDHWDELLHRSDKIIVGCSEVSSPNAVIFDGKVVLAQGFKIVYFEILRKWFTIMKVWNPKSEHTGYYCDIVTPFRLLHDGVVQQTDLFLDLWVSPDLRYKILDEDEFEDAVRKNWVNPKLCEKAKRELQQLIRMVEDKKFPPRIVKDLERKLRL